VPVDEGARVGEQRPDVRPGQVGEQRPAAGGQLRGQPHADVGDQRRAPWGPLLDDVEDLPPVQDGEVRGVADRVDQPGQHRPGQPGQRLLARVRAADLEGAHAQAVAALLGQVDDEAGGDELGEERVGRRAGEAEVAGQRGGRHRARLPGERLEQRERLPGRGDTGRRPHALLARRPRHPVSVGGRTRGARGVPTHVASWTLEAGRDHCCRLSSDFRTRRDRTSSQPACRGWQHRVRLLRRVETTAQKAASGGRAAVLCLS